MPNCKAHAAGRAKKAAVESDAIFFYLPDERPYGVLCQWHPSTIILPTVRLEFLVSRSTAIPSPSTILNTHAPCISFTCAEQLYVFSKCLFFSDTHNCARVLSTSDPKEQKKIGQNVNNFNEYKWTRVKSRVVRVGNWYKFCQNKKMREVLLATGERELVEASSKDRVWGIGFKAEDAEENRGSWGENRLGKAMVSVRGRMRALLEREAEEEKLEEWDGVVDEGDEEEGLDEAVEA